jgi:hypothetical protein
MEDVMNKIGRGVSIVAKVLTSVLWIACGVVGVSAGQPVVILPVVAYLAYLWVFNGRWLIY